ncbi:MAG TPA: hypothetical protein VN764_14680 [Polyangiaceae bacterium]|nr:hypothetical protein [Polyangiaceae bacterium]
MAQELGENFEGLKKLQGLVEFLPTKQPYIGFGESAPVDGTHDDNAEEQADRRVEVLFFAQGQEPDIALLDEDPKVSELYHPDAFNRAEVDPMASARRWFAKWEAVEVPQEGEEAAPLAASEGKALRLVVRGVGITSDVALSFLVEPVEPPQGQPHVPQSVEAVNENGLASAEFSTWDFDTHPQFAGLLGQGSDFPAATFRFTAVGGGRQVKSRNVVPYSEDLTM